MRKYKNACGLLVALALVACGEPDTVCIKMVCTSDVHGSFFPYDFIKNRPAEGSLARVSSYLKTLRTADAYGDNVVYMDNGDILQGQPTAYYYNTVNIEEEHVAAAALDYLGCDVAVLGNHDIETGGPTYQRYANELDCDVVGANILFEDTPHTFLPPYTIVEREGVRIAVLGLTTPAIPNWLPRNLWRELEFEDMERAARKWMEHLQQHASPDVVVGLFHSGYEGGIVTDEYAENATRDVAVKVPGFDAIFYGHDHRARCEQVVNVEGDTVWLVNPGARAGKVATLDIAYTKGKAPKLSAELVDMEAYEPDEAYMEQFAQQIAQVKEYVDKKIGASACEARAEEALYGPSGFVDFIHTMQLDITGAQVSLAAPLAYNAMLPKGDVRVRDMFDLYRYENMLYVMRLTGTEIKGHLEMAYALWTNQVVGKEKHLLRLEENVAAGARPRLEQPIYNFDSAAGILYEVDITKPEGQKVTIRSMADGTPFDMEATYRVAVNSYRGNGGGELLTKGAGIPHEELEGRIDYATDVDLRFYMLNYIEMHQTINPQSLGHWRFVPERMAAQLIEHDRALIMNFP